MHIFTGIIVSPPLLTMLELNDGESPWNYRSAKGHDSYTFKRVHVVTVHLKTSIRKSSTLSG